MIFKYIPPTLIAFLSFNSIASNVFLDERDPLQLPLLFLFHNFYYNSFHFQTQNHIIFHHQVLIRLPLKCFGILFTVLLLPLPLKFELWILTWPSSLKKPLSEVSQYTAI